MDHTASREMYVTRRVLADARDACDGRKGRRGTYSDE
jgi:hypothetical protein